MEILSSLVGTQYSETLENRLPKNCDGELTYSGRAGIRSGSVDSIFDAEGSGKPDRILSLPMSEGATKPARYHKQHPTDFYNHLVGD